MWNDPVTWQLYPEMNVHICIVHLSWGRHYLGGWSEQASCSRRGRTKERFSHICAHEYLDLFFFFNDCAVTLKDIWTTDFKRPAPLVANYNFSLRFAKTYFNKYDNNHVHILTHFQEILSLFSIKNKLKS